MTFTYEIKCLSKQFAIDYPLAEFPELLFKAGRPYNCLLVDTHASYKICIPFRSSSKHQSASFSEKAHDRGIADRALTTLKWF